MTLDELENLPKHNLGNDYLKNQIFKNLDYYADFYESMSDVVMMRFTSGTLAYYNIDTYVFMAMKGTMQSIKAVLEQGRINDAYALLRKYYDSTIINIYCILYLKDHYGVDNFIVHQIENWRKGKESIPEYRIMSQYIQNHIDAQEISKILKKDDRYKLIRDRCNDHVHYNFYANLLLNDNKSYMPERIEHLSVLDIDLENLFIQHLAYLFFAKDIYMASSDHIDHLDMGYTPPDDSQYWVASFIQDVFDKLIKTKRLDVYEAIKNNTVMHLQ